MSDWTLVVLGSDERTLLTDAVPRPTSGPGGTRSCVIGPPAQRPDEDAKQWAQVGREVGEAVARGEAGTGVLFCWTGTGASIAANKVPGVRAALCADAADRGRGAEVERRERAGDEPAAHEPRGRARDARRVVRHGS